MNTTTKESKTGLARHIGLLGLTATGICSMMGAAINFIPFNIQRNIEGIGADVLPAYMVAMIPAFLAALAYAVLASAMPRAGGSYVYASRAINPYFGFVASFSQWFGLSIAIGVVSYVIVPFMRDAALAVEATNLAAWFESGPIRLSISLGFLWLFVWINIRGVQLYEKTLIPLMFIMFALGAIVIFAGFSFNHSDFATALMEKEGRAIPDASGTGSFNLMYFLAASAVLFSSFIGFDSIAQAGGEAKNPNRNLPIAIGLTIAIVGIFYMFFTAAVYNAIPWQFIAAEAAVKDISAPGLLGYLLSPTLTMLILTGAVIALINDLPAMLLATSRLMFAWAEDGIFPSAAAKVHPKLHTPHIAIILSAVMSSIGILGCHFAGDFFLGVDLLLISMLFNFLVMCLSVLMLPIRNPEIAKNISIFKSPMLRNSLAGFGALMLTGLLIIHISKDLDANVDAWYFHSTWTWLVVILGASAIYFYKMSGLRKSGVNVDELFKQLPPE
ncbi:MAG: APC family permease [Calditrichia bacterium]